jgi:hypothetical protein
LLGIKFINNNFKKRQKLFSYAMHGVAVSLRRFSLIDFISLPCGLFSQTRE